MKGDIANKKLVKKLIKESDVVVNMAAETHVDRSIANTWLFPPQQHPWGPHPI